METKKWFHSLWHLIRHSIIILMDRKEELVSTFKSYLCGFLFSWHLILAVRDAYIFKSNYSDLTISYLLGKKFLCLLFHYFMYLVNNLNFHV